MSQQLYGMKLAFYKPSTYPAKTCTVGTSLAKNAIILVSPSCQINVQPILYHFAYKHNYNQIKALVNACKRLRYKRLFYP